jgi:hypothetical protein
MTRIQKGIIYFLCCILAAVIIISGYSIHEFGLVNSTVTPIAVLSSPVAFKKLPTARSLPPTWTPAPSLTEFVPTARATKPIIITTAAPIKLATVEIPSKTSTFSSSQPEWVLLHTSNNPPPMSDSGYAYNTKSDYGIVFGGLLYTKFSDETWIWNGNDWRREDVINKPIGRIESAMAYDEARDKMVLFGGRSMKTDFDDTWEWDGKSWLLINTIHKPPARCCHAMAYDNIQKKVIMNGGYNNLTGEYFNDTWTWDGNDWTQLPSDNIPPQDGHALVNFQSENKVVAMPTSWTMDTWEWNGKKWSEIASLPNPSRIQSGSVYDSQNKRIVFFGGAHQSDFYNDTWVFGGITWHLLNIPLSPPARYGHVMFYDETRHSIIMFGGTGTYKLFNDTWELSLPQNLSSVIVEKTPTP